MFPGKCPDCLPPCVGKKKTIVVERSFQEGDPKTNLELCLLKRNLKQVTCRRMNGTMGKNLSKITNPFFNVEEGKFQSLKPSWSMPEHLGKILTDTKFGKERLKEFFGD